MKSLKTGVLLINLGTPDSPEVKDVRKYLREFLSDERVIDISALGRWFLVNLIIAPFRSPKSSAEYKKLWTKEGSPLLTYGIKTKELLQQELGEDYIVSFGMRYQNPSIESALQVFKDTQVKELVVIPLYPQYASASTGSTIQKVNEILNTWQIIPNLKIVSNFTDNDLFIKSIVDRSKKWLEQHQYDHYMFSYHGLPERQILKGSCDNYCKMDKCCNTYHSKNYYCYRAQCFETTRRVAKELNIEEKDYTVCFQSRLGKEEWVKPYTDVKIEELYKEGKRKVLVFSPAFVSDCLETTVEVGETYKEEFLELGGERWDLVESLNDSPIWIECLKNMVTTKS